MAWGDREEHGHDLYSGHLYVFVSRRGDRLKILTWSAGGFLLLYNLARRRDLRMVGGAGCCGCARAVANAPIGVGVRGKRRS